MLPEIKLGINVLGCGIFDALGGRDGAHCSAQNREAKAWILKKDDMEGEAQEKSFRWWTEMVCKNPEAFRERVRKYLLSGVIEEEIGKGRAWSIRTLREVTRWKRK